MSEPKPIVSDEDMAALLDDVAHDRCTPADAKLRIEAWADSYARRAVLHERQMVAQANAQAAKAQNDLQKSAPASG